MYMYMYMYMYICTHIYADAYTYFVLLLVNKGLKYFKACRGGCRYIKGDVFNRRNK